MRLPRRADFETTGWVLSFLVFIGAFWMLFTRKSAGDFQTYHYAAQRVLQGRGMEIFSEFIPPNRYVYIPGFAWLIAPIALLPMKTSFLFWTFFVALMLLKLCLLLKSALKTEHPSSACIAAFGVILMVRPLLYVFLHGTVDALIAVICFWALWTLARSSATRASRFEWDTFFVWVSFSIFSFTKIITLPLMTAPWLLYRRTPSKSARWGQAVGVCLILLIPLITLSHESALQLLLEWKNSLSNRGIPIEASNQSFIAFLFHWFSGMKINSLALAAEPISYGIPIFSQKTIHVLGAVWSVFWIILILLIQSCGILLLSPLAWSSLLTGCVIIPSHILWRPYLAFLLPAIVVSLALAVEAWKKENKRMPMFLVLFLFLLINCTTFDFIGVKAHVFAELICALLWAHIGCLILLWRLDLSNGTRLTPAK